MAHFDVLGLCSCPGVVAQALGCRTEVGSKRGGFWVVSNKGAVPAERGVLIRLILTYWVCSDLLGWLRKCQGLEQRWEVRGGGVWVVSDEGTGPNGARGLDTPRFDVLGLCRPSEVVVKALGCRIEVESEQERVGGSRSLSDENVRNEGAMRPLVCLGRADVCPCPMHSS
jgi:hypothetical protein